LEWFKAKNYTVIFLLLLNIFLFGFNFVQRYKTTLSAARIENVNKLMEERDITIGCSLPGRFQPMSRIKMKPYDYDYMELEKVFFKSLSGIVRTEEFDSVILKSDEGSLVVKGNCAEFTGKSRAANDVNDAIDISDGYVDMLNEVFSNYKYDNAAKIKDGFRVVYYEEIADYDVFGNYADITIGNDGTIQVNISYYQCSEANGEKNTIIAADEAIFALSDKIRGRGVKIDKVSQGYIASGTGSEEMEAIPVYCIKAGSDVFFVNGVDGSVR
jgi:hypothetical protein